MFRRMFKLEGQTVRVRLEEQFRDLLQHVSEELRELLIVGDKAEMRRLYPTAYPDDESLDEAYQEMVHDQLLMQRLDGIDQMQATLGDDQISLEVADLWMSTINQCRLVLGTRLDVGEQESEIDHDDPDAQAKVIYQVLSMILEDLTSARLKAL